MLMLTVTKAYLYTKFDDSSFQRYHWASKFKTDHVTMTMPFQWWLVIHRLRLGRAMFNLCAKFEASSTTRYEHRRGNAKSRKWESFVAAFLRYTARTSPTLTCLTCV